MMDLLLGTIGTLAVVLFLGSVASLPFSATDLRHWAILCLGCGFGIVGLGVVGLAYTVIPRQPGDFLGSMILFIGGGAPTVISARVLFRFLPHIDAAICDETLIEIDELPRDIRRAVRPYVRGRWITESDLQERLRETQVLVKQMAAATKSQTDLLREDAVRKRLEAQERMFEQMHEEDRAVFAAQLVANADAKVRAETTLGTVERERNRLLQVVSALQQQVEDLRRQSSATPVARPATKPAGSPTRKRRASRATSATS